MFSWWIQLASVGRPKSYTKKHLEKGIAWYYFRLAASELKGYRIYSIFVVMLGGFAHILTKKRIVLPLSSERCSDSVYVKITCQGCL